MRKSKIGSILVVLGICFIIFYLIVRIFFIKDISNVLAQAQVYNLENQSNSNVSGYLFTYVIWSYSFKLGAFLVLIGGAIISRMKSIRIWFFSIGGILYLSLCYLPIGYYPLFFGIQGTLSIIFFLFIIWYWVKKRSKLEKADKHASDFRIIGYYFFIVATWNLCGIFGVATYALKPEEMIKHGLQTKAIMLASHVMTEFIIGWFFIFLSMYKEYSVLQND